MNSFKLVQHNVKSASFIENNEKEKIYKINYEQRLSKE